MSDLLTLAPTTDPVSVYRYRDGLYAGDLVTAAVVHLDFFTWLDATPSTLEQICQHYDFAERPTDVMLTLFTANQWIAQKDGVYSTTQLAREHLTQGSVWNLAAYYASLKDRPVALDFLRVLKTGKPANWGSNSGTLDWHKAMETEAFAQSFTAAMDCRGHYLGQNLARKAPLSDRTRLLDIGGGSGIYACSLCAHHPHLSATVFEQPPVDRITRRCIEERGFTDKVEVLAGNMFTDPLPHGFDTHLFSNVLHDWDAPEVAQLLAFSYASLAPGGLLIIHDAFIHADKTGPLPVAEYSAMLMHATQGKCWSVQEYAEFLQNAGFTVGSYTDTAADRGMMTAYKRPSEGHEKNHLPTTECD